MSEKRTRDSELDHAMHACSIPYMKCRQFYVLGAYFDSVFSCLLRLVGDLVGHVLNSVSVPLLC